jgi:hypothetical protein
MERLPRSQIARLRSSRKRDITRCARPLALVSFPVGHTLFALGKYLWLPWKNCFGNFRIESKSPAGRLGGSPLSLEISLSNFLHQQVDHGTRATGSVT